MIFYKEWLATRGIRAIIKIIMSKLQEGPIPRINRHQNNPQQSQESSYQVREERLNAQILRVKSQDMLNSIRQVWNMEPSQLIDFFTDYRTIYQFVRFPELIALRDAKLISTEHKIYLGQIKQKQKHGKGFTVYRDGNFYQGQYINNQRQGLGCEVYANGNMYVGEYHQNKKHGKGTFFWFSYCQGNATKQEPSKVEQYEGTWWGGLPDGQGQHQKVNGDFYIGHYKNGLKHGQGIEYYSNGDKYTGQFVNGLPEGFGTYQWTDHSHYKGDFKQGFRNGYGVWYDPRGKQHYKGHYMLDRKHGYGIYDWSNGYLYKGNFIEDQRCGQGQLFYQNKLVYHGFWLNGERCEEEDYLSHDLQSKTIKNSVSDHKLKGHSTVKKFSKSKGKDMNSQSFLVNFHLINNKQQNSCRNRSCTACKLKPSHGKSVSKHRNSTTQNRHLSSCKISRSTGLTKQSR